MTNRVKRISWIRISKSSFQTHCQLIRIWKWFDFILKMCECSESDQSFIYIDSKKICPIIFWLLDFFFMLGKDYREQKQEKKNITKLGPHNRMSHYIIKINWEKSAVGHWSKIVKTSWEADPLFANQSAVMLPSLSTCWKLISQAIFLITWFFFFLILNLNSP